MVGNRVWVVCVKLPAPMYHPAYACLMNELLPKAFLWYLLPRFLWFLCHQASLFHSVGRCFPMAMIDRRRIAHLYHLLHPRKQKLVLDYSVHMVPRYGYGKPPHAGLRAMISAGEKPHARFFTAYAHLLTGAKLHTSAGR